VKRVSVIIPCYNAENYIDRCIDSVISQNIGTEIINIVCVDDASSDGTYEKLLEWESKYPENIIILHCDTNRRQGAARNLAFEYADTEYITYLDADDFIDKDFIGTLLEVADKSKAQMVACGHVRDCGDGIIPECKKISGNPYKAVYISADDMRADEIRFASADPQVWGRLIRRDYIIKSKLIFPEGLTYEDNFWRMMLACTIEYYCIVDMPLYHYFVNEESTIMTNDSMHHVDFITVQMLKWDYVVNMGYYARYTDAVEFDLLHNCYLDFLKLICYRYSEPPYSLFRLLQQIVSNRVCDPTQNRYYEKGFNEFQKLLLGFISMQVSREEFKEMALLIRKNGI